MRINIDINIDTLTEDELLALNRRVIARLKLIQQHSTLNSMIKFEVGQSSIPRLWWCSPMMGSAGRSPPNSCAT